MSPPWGTWNFRSGRGFPFPPARTGLGVFFVQIGKICFSQNKKILAAQKKKKILLFQERTIPVFFQLKKMLLFLQKKVYLVPRKKRDSLVLARKMFS